MFITQIQVLDWTQLLQIMPIRHQRIQEHPTDTGGIRPQLRAYSGRQTAASRVEILHYAWAGPIGIRPVPEDDDFLIFRQVIVDPLPNQPIHPLANFKVCFHFANLSINTNKLLSLIPIPFIIAQPGFRSKTWMIGQKTGLFQGFYEWDTLVDAEKYWTSFPLRLMKRRAAPDSMTYSITASMNFK